MEFVRYTTKLRLIQNTIWKRRVQITWRRISSSQNSAGLGSYVIFLSYHFPMRTCSWHIQIVLLTHRNAFCWLDEWFDLTFEEVLLPCLEHFSVASRKRMCCKGIDLYAIVNGCSFFLAFLSFFALLISVW